MEYFPILNLTDALEKHDALADWFVDEPRHCNHKANQVFAHAIYEELLPVLQQLPKGRGPIEQDHDYVDRFYLRHYFSNFDPTGHGVIGSIVMNCNPFTLGHRFLIEEALKTVDFLIRPLAKLSKAVKITDTSDKRKAKGKTHSAIAVAFREDTKPFDETDGVFNKDAFS